MANKSEWAWVAGILEGEGSFYTGRRSKSIRCAMHTRDKDVMLKLHEITTVGGLYYTKVTEKHPTPMYVWQVSNKEDILWVCDHILPFMGNRRKRQIYDLLEYYAFGWYPDGK